MNNLLLNQISNGINKLLKLDPESKKRLDQLDDKTITIELLPFKLTFQCRFHQSSVAIHKGDTMPSDVKLSGTPLQLLGVVIEKNNRHRFFADDLVMEGNAAIGQEVIALFDQLDIDWEDQLSKVIGDSATHHASQLLSTFKSWLSTTNDDFNTDITHYLHDEKNWFPTRHDLQDFFDTIDDTRMAVDRLEAKLSSLTQVLNDENLS